MTENQKMANEDLHKYYEAKRDLVALHREIEVLESRCNRSVKSPDSIMWDTGRKTPTGQVIRVPMPVQTTMTGNVQETLLSTLADRRDYYWHKCVEAERMAFEIEMRINKYCNSIYARVLSLYYVCGQRLEQIAVTVNFSYQHVKRLKWRALEQYGSRLKDEPQ